MATEDDTVENLSKIFDDGLELFNAIDKTDEPTNSSDVQVKVKRAMGLFEKATKLVSITGMYSSNESIEEVSTNELQYLLLPAFLGTLSLKITLGERKEIVEVAEIYFRDFLQRCNDYGLSDYNFKDPQNANKDEASNKSQFEQLTGMVLTRRNKIQRFKEQKELQTKLDNLKTNMDNPNIDDELKRNYMLTMIKIFIYKSMEELDSIDMEKPMIAHMENQREQGVSLSKREPPKIKPLRPVIITKDDVQKAVFGAGYPSLPTMTVKEFYDKRVLDGVFPDPSKPRSAPMTLQERALAGIEPEEDSEDAENERKEEIDDPQMLQRLRDRDEYKDDHRRGWGNRMNRS